jgi:tetratricopeptide (TPR) repeat protein
MAEVQRHDYRAAARTFQRLVDDFPAEGFLADRARVYLQLAQRELERRPAAEGGVEERLTAATAALNEDDVATAERLAESVRREDASLDLAPYLLAIVAMRKSDHDTAMSFLRTAIALNPENRIQARQDEEFDALFNLDEFHELTETPADQPDPSGLMGLAGRRPAKRGK